MTAHTKPTPARCGCFVRPKLMVRAIKPLTPPSLTPDERATLAQHGEWVAHMCLAFGASVATAYKVAGYFVEGVEKNWLASKPASES